MSNSFDPDQAQQLVGPDLGPHVVKVGMVFGKMNYELTKFQACS